MNEVQDNWVRWFTQTQQHYCIRCWRCWQKKARTRPLLISGKKSWKMKENLQNSWKWNIGRGRLKDSDALFCLGGFCFVFGDSCWCYGECYRLMLWRGVEEISWFQRPDSGQERGVERNCWMNRPGCSLRRGVVNISVMTRYSFINNRDAMNFFEILQYLDEWMILLTLKRCIQSYNYTILMVLYLLFN